MSLATSAIARLTARYPHSEPLLTSFTPLLEAQETLAESLPPPALPLLDQTAFTQGKAWLEGRLDDVLDAPFLTEAPGLLARAAAKGFPAIEESVGILGGFLTANPAACRELVELAFTQKLNKVASWAKKYGQGETAATLMGAHLGGAAARRAARMARGADLSAWRGSTCPVCASRPHGGSIKGKEGKRYLQCSLCRHEWLFSRTSCPSCLQDSPQEVELFFFEDTKQMRAEACKVCNHYLLCVDTRELLDDTPVELFLLCMMPLDLLMQEKKYIPVALGAMRRSR